MWTEGSVKKYLDIRGRDLSCIYSLWVIYLCLSGIEVSRNCAKKTEGTKICVTLLVEKLQRQSLALFLKTEFTEPQA